MAKLNGNAVGVTNQECSAGGVGLLSRYGCRPQKEKTGILLAQLGTPDAPTAKALRPYLKQFLSDRRVIEINKVLWWFLLNGIILRLRPRKSAKLYERIWTEEGSPLLVYTNQQCQKLAESIAEYGEVEVRWGMRYGTPSLESAMDELIDAGCQRLLVFPMYPQYAASTTASAYDAIFPHLLKRRWVPTVRVVDPYFAHNAYVDSLATVINEHLASLDETPERLILSYHGVPVDYVKKGDPYCCQCRETTAALIPKIEYPAENIIHCYQSRFGNDPWLTPYTDKTVEELGKQGIKHVAVACPGFTADCLETIDEMGNELLEEFEEHGGERVSLIPCLNDHPRWIEGMVEIARESLGAWLIPAGEERKGACLPCSAGCFKSAG